MIWPMFVKLFQTNRSIIERYGEGFLKILQKSSKTHQRIIERLSENYQSGVEL